MEKEISQQGEFEDTKQTFSKNIHTKKLISFFGAAALSVLSACTNVRYIKLEVKCNNPNPQTLCLKGDIKHECTDSVLKDWANENCKNPKSATITQTKSDTKCIRCSK